MSVRRLSLSVCTLSLLGLGLAAVPTASRAGDEGGQDGILCRAIFPGVQHVMAFSNPDGTLRQPTEAEVAALEASEKQAHDYQWEASSDKATGMGRIQLVDRMDPERLMAQPGVEVARIPIRGRGQRATANLILVSQDSAGEGINDTTPRSPVGGNSGTTLGAQRLNSEVAAATFWADRIVSSVDIRVAVDWASLTCNGSGAILGSAGPFTGFRDFTNAPAASTWYAVALANKFKGSDLDASNDDITAQFNKALDESCALALDWYYGLDGNFGANLDFADTFRHELGHGLGFLTFADVSTGALAGGLPDCFLTYLRDESLGMSWPAMTDLQRQNSAKNNGNLTWFGAGVTGAAVVLSSGRHGSGRVRMYAPTSLTVGSSVSHWDEALIPDEMMEPIADPNPINTITLAAFTEMGWMSGGSPTPTPSATATASPTPSPTPGGFGCGSNVNGQLTDSDGSYFGDGTKTDVYTLTLASSTDVTLTLSTSAFDPYVSVFAPGGAGSQIIGNHSGTVGVPAVASGTLPAGTYDVVVNEWSVVSHPANYNLTLNCGGATPTPSATPTASPTPSNTPTATPTTTPGGPSSDPNVVLTTLNSTQWDQVGLSGIFSVPNFSESGGLGIFANDPSNTFGFWQTHNTLNPLTAGRYKISVALAGTGTVSGKRHPEIRVRIFRGDNRYSAMGLVAETASGQGVVSPVDVGWTSDGVTPWRVAVDILSFAPDAAGGVTVTGFTVTPNN